MHSRALGVRIGSILHARYTPAEGRRQNTSSSISEISPVIPVANGQDGPSVSIASGDHDKKRKHQVIIHTSPFLRCIQTSIAISAGIAQFEGSIQSDGQSHPPKHHPMHSEAQRPTHPASPHLTGIDNRATPHLAAIPEPDGGDDESAEDQGPPVDNHNPCLRIDAFLGEWLSPEYFDMITPPPSSVMMLTSAKSELMRRGEYVDVPVGSYRSGPGQGNFPGGWGNGSQAIVDASDQHENGPLSTISTVGATLPRLNRASSHSNVSSSGPSSSSLGNPKSVSTIEATATPRKSGYEPPIPSYAISPSDPIPPGYVAHARDACTEVDFQWDSMREPHDWGNGGAYGEEWSGMHKRFRRGLQSMIVWYQHNHAKVTTQDIINGSHSRSEEVDEQDEDTDIVLILVTHGAGCNALIGALTNQPVLLDVGMASLTLAVRKQTSDELSQSPFSPNPPPRRQSLIDIGFSTQYDVKITASTEHLHARSRGSTTAIQHFPPSLWSTPVSTHRYRTHSAASSTLSNSLVDGDFRHNFENRAMTSTSIIDGLSESATSSGGLWSKPVPKNKDGTGDPLYREGAAVPNGHSPLGNEILSGSTAGREDTITKGEHDRIETANGASGNLTTQNSLWGAPPTTTATGREKGYKRRWTHSEQR